MLNMLNSNLILVVGLVLLLCLFCSKKEPFYGVQHIRARQTIPNVSTLSRIIRDQTCDPEEPPQFNLLPVCHPVE